MYVIFKNRQLRKLLNTTNELKNTRTQNLHLHSQMQMQRDELEQAKTELTQKAEELQRIKEELQQYDEELQQKRQELATRTRQSQHFLSLLHQVKLENKAEDVVQAIRQSSDIPRQMTDSEIKQLYKAVDDLFPNFWDTLVQQLGRFSDEQQLVYYLLRIGLTNRKMQNLTTTPKATIWRWAKRYNEIISK